MSNLPVSERFWSKVAKGSANECWLWQEATTEDGYGRFKLDSISCLAHRVAWFLTYSRWPELCVLHKCDNPPCVNPNHLFEGTRADNNQDKVKKGRQPRGEQNGKGKLTEVQVKDILQLLNEGRHTHREIAKMFNVGKTIIGNINIGKKWKHIKRKK